MKTSHHQHTFRILTFHRCGVPFAVEVSHVREIRKFENFRPLALGIHPLLGVVSQDDRIIPVFDPHAFGTAARQPVDGTLTTVICGPAGSEIALLADEVHNQSDVHPGQLHRPPGGSAEWLRGEVELVPGKKLFLLAAHHLEQLAATDQPEPPLESEAAQN